MANLPEPFKKADKTSKMVQGIVRNNSAKKSGKEVPDFQKQTPGKKK